MARKPDLNSEFAQKLLGDIRARKERLGYASSSSGQRATSATSSFNAEANSRRSFRGAQETTKNNFLPPNSRNKGIPSPQRKTKQPTMNSSSSSQQIIPYRKARTPATNNGDISMALALALSNTGKLQNIEVLSRTKIGTEFVTHRGSIRFSGTNYRLNGRAASDGSEFLFVPNFGVQKLSEMIGAITNGRNKRSSSLAVELEQSLNMLVMLQDASDYMNVSNKDRVLMIKDKEENYDEKGFRSKSTKQSKLNSVKKNSGTGVNTKKENYLLVNTSSWSFRNSNNSKPTKENSEHSNLRIPSVIARLMGLEDLPEPVKHKVEIKEVESQEKGVKSEFHMERFGKKENDMSGCQVELKEETRLERITRTYIDSKKGIFGNCAINAKNIPPKKTDEKMLIVRNKKKMEKPNHEVVKQKTVLAPKKVLQNFRDKDLTEKRSKGDTRSGKVVNSNLVSKKKEVDGNMRESKNNKILEKGGRNVDRHVKKNKNLMELRKEKVREAEVQIADLEGDDFRKDDDKCSKEVLDQSSSEGKNYNEITSMNLDSCEGPQISIPGHELLQLQEDEQTDSCNCIKGSTNLHYEDSLTENQILLKDVFLSDPEFVGLSQSLFTVEVTIAESEKITKTPLEKDNNKVLLHTAHEIIKRKAARLNICDNMKIMSLNSLIRELDSDFQNLGYGREFEDFDLQKIIEREIGYGNPDSNCMWEFSWNPKLTAQFEKCEIVREMEKHLTSGLITELTRDLVDEIILV